ncbi:hypothetical protein [Sandaracinus amylolyticus]|uniref:hypothetical protein n=1 Tax=Sandaracinus amylolyticus TaxID=927083 RepID=UPI001F256F91|nr:hypothetical protein [Sandaracinus amylolyticus]UJR81526.1 Hypothetical protein I5071_35860 [Sandaracinus amylolyticus]
MRRRALSSIPPRPIEHARRRDRASGTMLRAHPRAELLAGMTVLVVDSHADTREMVAQYVELHGARVISIATAADALVVLRAFQVDVLISSASTLDDDDPGLALVTRMSTHPKWRAIGCVVVSCEAQPRELVGKWRRIVVLRRPFELERVLTATLQVAPP